MVLFFLKFLMTINHLKSQSV